MLRPRPYTKPHPPIVRAAPRATPRWSNWRARASPFLMNVQSLETTRRRVELYRQTMREAGL